MVTKNSQKEINSLKHEVERLRAVVEIQNLMSRYAYWHSANKHEKVAEFIAKKAPDIRFEFVNSGVYESAEGARRFMVDVHNWALSKDREGLLLFHPLTTPVIEVAGDGKTAKGLWIGIGPQSLRIDGKIQARWAFEQYAADFIKEDGKWKFWRIHLYNIFDCPFEKSWVEEPTKRTAGPERHPHLPPDRPTTYDNPYSPTGRCSLMEHVPPAPEPYEIWDDSMALK